MSESSHFKKTFRLGLTLFVVTALTGLILGGVEALTAPAILKTQQKEKAEALLAVLPEADAFSEVPLNSGADPLIHEVQEAKKGGSPVGWCVTVSPKGYAGAVVTVVGLTSDGAVNAIRILKQSETPGLGAKASEAPFSGQFRDKKDLPLAVVKRAPGAPNEIQAISGATITSAAVVSGVNAAVEYWEKFLKGGVTP